MIKRILGAFKRNPERGTFQDFKYVHDLHKLEPKLFKKKVRKPWGYEFWLEVNDKYAMKQLVVHPNARLSLQYHEQKRETMLCVRGTGTLELDGKRINFAPGSCRTIMPGQKHRLIASDEGLSIIECSTPELDDVVRLEDLYGRK